MIIVDKLYKGFDGTQVLKGISTTFESGKTSLIIGQSGSGKTVFLKSLSWKSKYSGGGMDYHINSDYKLFFNSIIAYLNDYCR